MRTARFFSFVLITILFSPNGFAQDYTQWHLPEGAIVRFEKGGIGDFAFLPDGNRLAIQSAIGLWIYDVHTGEELDLFTDLGTKLRWNLMVLSPDGRTLAAATDSEVVLWDLQTNKLNKLLVGHEDRIYSLAFSPTGEILAGGSRDTTVRLWDVNTGELLKAFFGHTDSIRWVAYSNDGKTLACVGWKDSTIRISDVSTGELLTTIADHASSIYRIVYAPDSQTLASGGQGCQDSYLGCWHRKTPEYL